VQTRHFDPFPESGMCILQIISEEIGVARDARKRVMFASAHIPMDFRATFRTFSGQRLEPLLSAYSANPVIDAELDGPTDPLHTASSGRGREHVSNLQVPISYPSDFKKGSSQFHVISSFLSAKMVEISA
jgi:hypothetical protein